MATSISFPVAPNPGDTYTYMSATYVWTGTYWRISSLGSTYVPYTGATGNVNLGAYNLSANAVTFATSPVVPSAVGSTYWDTVNKSLSSVYEGGSIYQHGQELYINGKASEAISNGDAVQSDGAEGNHTKIKKAVPAEILANPLLLIGIATQNIASGDFGNVTFFGKINDVYTTGWSVNDTLYFNNTVAGGVTNVLPVAPNPVIVLGKVVKLATGASENGVIRVLPPHIIENHEVPLTFSNGLTRTANEVKNNLITGLAGGQAIIGGTAASNTLTLSSTSHATKGKILFGTSAYDEVNNRLGIGTINPTDYLTINTSVTQKGIEIYGSSFPMLKIGTSSSSAIQIYNETSNNLAIINSVSYGLPIVIQGSREVFSPSGTEVMRVTSSGVSIGAIVSPTALLHIKAGTATASTAPLKFTSGTLNTTAEAGAMEFLTDDYYLTITTSAARKGILLNDGTKLTAGRLPYVTTNGRITDSANLTYSATTGLSTATNVALTSTAALSVAAMSGTGNRIVQTDTSGNLTASVEVITGKLTDATAITNLTTDGNWTLGLYTGTAITSTYEGQYYRDDSYFYFCYADNDWTRIPRA